MRSIIELTYLPNGNLQFVETENSKLFQGSVAATEFRLKIAEGVSEPWLPTDSVFIAFERPDGKTANVFMQYDGSGGWYKVTNGWETDVDVSTHGSALLVSVTMRRYSTVSPGVMVATRTSEQTAVTIHPSTDWIPLDISTEDADILLAQIGVINGRLDAHDEALDAVNGRLDNKQDINLIFTDKAQIESWLAGTYTRPDGVTPDDLVVGRQLYTANDDESNYWVKTVPVVSMDNLSTAAGKAYDGTIYELEVDLSGY